MKMRYQVTDCRDGRKVGRAYTDMHKAYAKADAMDAEYGAVRYVVKHERTSE